jgi:nitroimidazol reductase NimA-like FMN-containing flavoprotein (pyridoxamine 5'-phosphate oxidase superfamily)
MSDTDTTEKQITADERARRRAFVAEHRTAIFGYNRSEDGPSMSCVYYVCDGEDLLVSSMAERAKCKAIARSPKVSLCVLDEQWPPTYLQVYCDASIETVEQRVVVRLHPYATFQTPPKHVYDSQDINPRLLHSLGRTMPWR